MTVLLIDLEEPPPPWVDLDLILEGENFGRSGIRKHVGTGIFEFDPQKITLIKASDMPPKNKGYGYYESDFDGLPVVNFNVPNTLMRRKDCIPKEWKDKRIFFPGTIFKTWDGNNYISCIYYYDGDWYQIVEDLNSFRARPDDFFAFFGTEEPPLPAQDEVCLQKKHPLRSLMEKILRSLRSNPK